MEIEYVKWGLVERNVYGVGSLREFDYSKVTIENDYFSFKEDGAFCEVWAYTRDITRNLSVMISKDQIKKYTYIL